MAASEFDIHTHTIASGHASTATITDMAKAAASRNLKLLGISDHGPATLGGGRPSYFRNLSYAPRKRLGVEMLYGAEVNILDENGSLDLEDPILAGSPFRYAMKMADVFYQEMEKNKDWIRPVTKYEEIEENRKNGKMSALLTLEEGEICTPCQW